MRNVEQRDIDLAKVDKRCPNVWEGKLLMVHYMSYRKADQTPRDDCDKLAYCSEVTYNSDSGYVLEKEHYVRVGLLWPFVGAEIGCWLRRWHLVDQALGYRKDKDGNLLPLRLAVGAPRNALFVLCPYLVGRVRAPPIDPCEP